MYIGRAHNGGSRIITRLMTKAFQYCILDAKCDWVQRRIVGFSGLSLHIPRLAHSWDHITCTHKELDLESCIGTRRVGTYIQPQ